MRHCIKPPGQLMRVLAYVQQWEPLKRSGTNVGQAFYEGGKTMAGTS